MKNKKIITYSVFVFAILFIISLVPLTDAIISDDTLTIKIYDIDNKSNVNGTEITFKVEFISSEYKGNNYNYTFKINSSELNTSKIFSSQDISYVVYSEAEEILNIDYLERYESCSDAKTSINKGYDDCTKYLDECKNHSNYKTDYETCLLDIKKNDLDIQSLTKNVEDLNKEKTDTKNEKWFWAIGGLIAGILGILFKQGKLGGNPKDASANEFNQNQAG